jgi:DNA-binding response OmpR family regulator
MEFRIIILDDEPDLGEVFAAFLQRPDRQIWTFTDPEECLRQVATIRPHLAFLDYRLPGTNGDIIASRMPASIPKVLITGELDVQLTQPFIEVFQKPFSLHEIGALIDGRQKQVTGL